MLGSHVVDRLLAAGAAEVVVFDRAIIEANLASALSTGRVRTITGDIRDTSAVSTAMEGCDVVVHLAAILLAATQESHRASLDINLCATFDLLDAAVRLGVRRVVYGSSVGIYGQPSGDQPITEDSPVLTRSWYGASKFASELYCRTFSDTYGLEHVILRLGTLYGERAQAGAFALRQLVGLMDKLDRGETPAVEGDPNEIHDLIYVGDAAEAVIRAITVPRADFSVHVVSGRPVSWGEVVRALLHAAGFAAEPAWQPRSLAWATHRRFSTALAEERLGFTAATSLPDGMQAMVRWHRSLTAGNPEGGAR